MNKYNVGDIVRLKDMTGVPAKIQGNVGDAYCLTFSGENHDGRVYSWLTLRYLDEKFEIIEKAVVVDESLLGCACYKDMKTGKLVIVSNGKNVPYCDGCVISVGGGIVYTRSGISGETHETYTYKFNEVDVI